MKKLTDWKTSAQHAGSRLAFRGGTYSLMLTAVVLAILIVVNIFVSALPPAMTQYDISASKLYSITSNTKVVVSALDQDVTIYWIVQDGKEDRVIENLLSKYETLSDHIHVEKKNPDVFPTFAQQYTDEDVANNSLVVESGTRSRYIGYDDIYVEETDLVTYSTDSSFDGEGAITSAIDYVVNEDQPRVYVLEGHGEAELPASFSEQMEKENMEVVNFSLLTEDAIPEDADCIVIYAPASDISDQEQTILADYVAGGGKLMVAAGPTEDGTLEHLYGLLSDYGVEAVDGIVVDPDRDHYAFQLPYVLMPDIASSDITDSLIDERYYALMPISTGLRVSETDNGTVTELLTTSESAFSKAAGYDLSTYEKEDGDSDGPFAVAVSVESNGGGNLVWFTSSVFLEDMYNAYSSGANTDLAMNALASLIGESEAMAIRSKSLNFDYLTISDSTASLLKTVMVGVFPLAYLAIGAAVVAWRRRQQHEAV